MHRILYISTARSLLAAEELEEILRTSRKNNARVGVTGLLVVGGRRFLQALEGERALVQETYERIRLDPRHFAFVTLSDQEISQREFANWFMGYEEGGAATLTDNLENQIANIIAPLHDPNLRAYFGGFAKSHSTPRAIRLTT